MIGRQEFRQAVGSCYIMCFRLRAGVVIAALIAETSFGGLPTTGHGRIHLSPAYHTFLGLIFLRRVK